MWFKKNTLTCYDNKTDNKIQNLTCEDITCLINLKLIHTPSLPFALFYALPPENISCFCWHSEG